MLSFNQLWMQMEHDRHASLLRQLKQELARDKRDIPSQPLSYPSSPTASIAPQRVKTRRPSPRRIRASRPEKGKINYQSC